MGVDGAQDDLASFAGGETLLGCFGLTLSDGHLGLGGRLLAAGSEHKRECGGEGEGGVASHAPILGIPAGGC